MQKILQAMDDPTDPQPADVIDFCRDMVKQAEEHLVTIRRQRREAEQDDPPEATKAKSRRPKVKRKSTKRRARSSETV